MRQHITLQRWFRRTRDLVPVAIGVIIGAASFFVIDRTVEAFAAQPPVQAIEPVPSFANCDAARAAGAAPLFRGQRGYNRRLDADGDGVACEPYPRRNAGPRGGA